MAQTTSIVDPWSGLIKGTETLRQAANAAEERKLNELRMQATKQQLAEGEMKLQQQRQAAEDLQARRDLAKKLESERVNVTTPGYGGLADVQAYENAVQANKAQGNLPAMWSDTATAPIPAGGQGINIPTLSGQTAPPAAPPVMGRGLSAATPSVYEQFSQNMAGKPPYTQDQLDALNEKAIAAQQASGLSSYGEKTTQRPLSELEKAQRLASLQLQQGDVEGGLKTVKAGVDITTQVPEAAQKVTTDILTRAYNAVASGVPADKAKADAVAYAKATYPPDLIKGIENIQLTPNGIGIIPTTGGIITTTFDPKTGGTKFEFHKTEQKDPFAGGFDVVDAKSRAQTIQRKNPSLTSAEAMEQAISQIRAEKQQEKQTNIQMRIDARGSQTPQQISAGTTRLRREFNALPEVKNYKTLSGQTAAMTAVLNRVSSFKSLNPADQVVIMDFNKILDPSSVVRESEYARTPTNMSVLNRASSYMSRLMQGGVLNATERQELVRAAGIIKESARTQYNAVRAQYTDIATSDGYDPTKVVPTLAQTGDETRTVARNAKTGETMYLSADGKSWVDKNGKPVK